MPSMGKAVERGALAVIVAAAACHSDMTQPTPLSGPRIYVADNLGGNSSKILIFAKDASGNAAPVDSIVGASTHLAFIGGLTADAAGNLYVANDDATGLDSGWVTVFAAGSTGNVAPARVIAGSLTGLRNPHGIAVDDAGTIFVPDPTALAVFEFAPGANGNAAPVVTLSDAEGPVGIAIGSDSSLYIGNPGSGTIWIYAKSAITGDVPADSIAGSNTLQPFAVSLAFDSSRRLYSPSAAFVSGAGIVAYPAGARGNASPVRTIDGASTGFSNPQGLSFDAGDTLYISQNSSPANVLAFAPSANGDGSPVRTIVGPATALEGPLRLVVH
jgi:hypothetical protein